MNLQEKVLDALVQVDKGSPLKDFLTDDEIFEAICMLGDILICAGFATPLEGE
jgi:hypothetical protein